MAIQTIKHILRHSLSEKYRLQYADKKEFDRLKSLPRYAATQTLCEGKKIKIPDAASFLFIQNEMFYKEIYRFRTLKEAPFIIDCGANIGLSILYFKKQYPNAKIIAFEPDPKIFEYLTHNIACFNYQDVKLYNNALWSEETFLNFDAEGADGGRIDVNKNADTVKVKTLKLSSFLDQPVDLLKIDIEGAEFEVLNECKTQLKNVERLFVEYHSFLNKEQDLDALLAIMKTAGFRYNIQHIGVFSKHPFESINNYAGMDLQLNIFAYR